MRSWVSGFVTLLAACTAHVQPSATAAAGLRAAQQATANPLGGRPLLASSAGSPDLLAMKKDTCSLWPILDTYKVTADQNRVCVSAELFLMSYESGPLPIASIEVSLAAVAGPPTVFPLAAAGLAKVGRCFGTDRLRTGLWSFQFVGCTPNAALVTASTPGLVLRRKKGLLAGSEGAELARWTFSDAKPAPFVAAPTAAVRPPLAVDSQARALYGQGAQLLAQQRYPEALELFSQCLDHDPGLSQGYTARGNALLGLRRYAEAAADYGYALELDAGAALPQYGLAEAARALNDGAKARGHYQRFLDSPSPEATPALKQDVARKLGSLR